MARPLLVIVTKTTRRQKIQKKIQYYEKIWYNKEKRVVSLMRIEKLQKGMSESVQKVITTKDTALNFGSGALKDLLATPTLVALMIEAAVNVVDPLLPDGYITVGKATNIIHSDSTIKGMTVTVKATIAEIDRNKIVFVITAFDELGEVGKGVHERYIVEYDKFMKKAADRAKVLESKMK